MDDAEEVNEDEDEDNEDDKKVKMPSMSVILLRDSIFVNGAHLSLFWGYLHFT